MDSLPYELLKAIVDRVSRRKDVLGIRTLNKTLCAVATARIFRRVNVMCTLKSATGFGDILERDIAQHVEVITFTDGIDFFTDGQFVRSYWCDRDLMLSVQTQTQIRLEKIREANALRVEKSLVSSFARILEFPRLKTLKLSFSMVYDPPVDRMPLQWTILSAISSQSPLPHLSSFEIQGLMAFHSTHYELPSFARLLSSVTRLHIAPDLGPLQDSRFRDPFIAFWEQVIQLDVLSSVSHSLTSFALHSNIDVGIVPRLDFSQVNLPALRSLSLEKILFNEETHIEDFIVRHKKTMKKLWFTECRIAVDNVEGDAPRQWSQIWEHFEGELKALVLLDVRSELHYDSSDDSIIIGYSDGPDDTVNQHVNHAIPMDYVQQDVDAGYSYTPIDMYLFRDKQALEKLQVMVGLQAAELEHKD